MFSRPTFVVALCAAVGTIGLRLATPMLPASSKYAPAFVGAFGALIVSWVLLRELPRPQRNSVAIASGVLGFFVGAAASATLARLHWPAGYGTAWLPCFLLFLAGFGSERLTHELSRLEDDIDRSAERPRVIARAIEIRDAAEVEARKLDKDTKATPKDASDPRTVFAYAAQVAGYGYALDERFDDAVASLGKVPPVWMPVPMRLLMLGNLAFWNLCRGDVAAAQKAIDSGDEEGSLPEARPHFRVSRAMVLVHAGKPAEALAIVGDTEGTEPARLRRRYALVRVHALVGSGREAEARTVLEEILEDPLGADEVRRWLAAGGPARPLVEELLAREDKPAKPAREVATEQETPSPPST
ncbi:MAG: hypothetical protein WKG00_05460 [Polyangiaceae bacterium]